jgi:hypothetical protein
MYKAPELYTTVCPRVVLYAPTASFVVCLLKTVQIHGWAPVGLLVCCLCQAKYCVDQVAYVDDLAAVLAAAAPPCIHVLAGSNTDRSVQFWCGMFWCEIVSHAADLSPLTSFFEACCTLMTRSCFCDPCHSVI